MLLPVILSMFAIPIFISDGEYFEALDLYSHTHITLLDNSRVSVEKYVPGEIISSRLSSIFCLHPAYK